MRRIFLGLTALVMLAGATPAFAQDGTDSSDGTNEIIVTGSLLRPRASAGALNLATPVTPPASVQMLRRTADFAIQQVVVASDTVDEDQARQEVLAMVRKAVDLARGSGVLVASGDLVVEPLTVANYTDLKVLDGDDDDNDPDDKIDGQFVKFLVKVPLAPGIDAKTALARIDQFIKMVPQVGRAEMKPFSELTLSVVNPEQYRGAIIDLVAKDTATTSARFGPGYGVEVTGLDKPVQWKRASLTEVQLYLPSNSTTRPRN
jgi:hypothetical protein